MSSTLDVWKLLAGLGIFLFGMLLIEASVKALSFIGIGAIGLILFKPTTRPALVTRLSIGFGFLFWGLDFMKISVESFAQDFSLADFAQYELWVCLIVGILFTALMQASAATIAIVLTGLALFHTLFNLVEVTICFPFLVLVNRLFTQSCRMQIYGMKDLLLTQEQITHFDRAMDAKEIIEDAKQRQSNDAYPKAAPSLSAYR